MVTIDPGGLAAESVGLLNTWRRYSAWRDAIARASDVRSAGAVRVVRLVSDGEEMRALAAQASFGRAPAQPLGMDAPGPDGREISSVSLSAGPARAAGPHRRRAPGGAAVWPEAAHRACASGCRSEVNRATTARGRL